MKTPRLIVTLCLMLVLEAMIAETFSTKEEEGLQKRGWFRKKVKNSGTKIKKAFGKIKNQIKKLRNRPRPRPRPEPEPEQQEFEEEGFAQSPYQGGGEACDQSNRKQ